MKKALTLALILAMSLVLVAGGTASAEWKPGRTIELIAPGGPGGGYDMLCRTVQKALTDEKLVEEDVVVVNKPGGGGTVGWRYLIGRKGQGEYLAATSTLIMLNNLLGKTEMTYDDITPIALMQAEWIAVAVKADAEWENVEDLFMAIKEDPTAVPVAVGPTLGNNDHLVFLQLADFYGVDPSSVNFIVYPEAGGAIIPSVLGGHAKATVIGLAEVLEQHKADNLKVLGVSSEGTLDFLPDVKSFTEQGADVVFPHWRGLLGAPGLTEDQIQYWDNVLSKMVETPTWNKLIGNLGWDNYYKNSKDFTELLEKQTGSFDTLLTKVGLKD